MNTEVVKAENGVLEEKALNKAVNILKNGGLVAFPTETVYGLGGNGTDALSAKKIYEAKGRPSDNPLIIHVADPKDAEKYAHTSEEYYKLADAFMPGPLTIILQKKEIIPFSVTGGLDTVAVRCPSHKVARSLIEAFGLPIAAPSANLSGKPSPTCAEHVIDDLFGKVDMIIDGGESEIGLESTIVKLDGNSVTLLRPGAITADAISCVCENVKIASSVIEKLGDNERPLSPGMKYRHYAPSAPFILLDGDDNDVLDFLKKEQLNNDCAILCYSEEVEHLHNKSVIDIGGRNDYGTQAKRLFSALREADKMNVKAIYSHLPKTTGLGLALYNRMIRAAAHTVKKI